MLLLLRSATGGPVTAALTGVGGLSATGSSVSAALTGVGAFTVSGSVELNLFASLDGVGGLVGISQGFQTRTAAITGQGDLNALGGFSGVANFAGLGGLSGTVGSTLQGTASLSGAGFLADGGIARADTTSILAGQGSLTGTGNVSGGTVTPSAALSANGSLTVTTPLFVAVINLGGAGALAGTGFPDVVGLATTMRLSFSADEIRTFFRGG